MVRPNVPPVTVSRRPTTSATRSRTTTTTTTRSRTALPARSHTSTSTTTTTSATTATGTPLRDDDNDQNQLLLLDAIVPFFDEYQTYCVTGAGSGQNDDDSPDNDPLAAAHPPTDTITSDRRRQEQLRDRLVQRIISSSILSRKCATTNPEPPVTNDGDSTNETGVPTMSPPSRPTPITECFGHILQAAVAHLIPSSSSSSSRGGTTIRPSSIPASSAILDLWVSTVVAGAAHHHQDDSDLWLSRLQEYSQCQFDAVRIVSVRALCHWAECLGRRSVETMDDATEQQRLDRLDTIQQAILPRFTDKAIAVRCAVVQACFTSTPNPLCTDPDLLQAIQWIVQHDPSSNNRQMALQHVPINRTTMEYVIPRIRDTKLNVRLAAIAALSRAVDRYRYDSDDDLAVFPLPSRHMAEMITCGYTDRCLTTKEAIRRMVCTSWIPAANYNPITLLQWLNVLDHPTVATTILQIWVDVSNASPPWFPEEDVSDRDQQRFRDGLPDSIAQFTISDLLSSDHHRASAAAVQQLCIARNLLQLIPSEYEKDVLWSQLIPDIPMLCQVLETMSSKLVEIVASQLSSPSQQSGRDDASTNEEDNMTFVCLELLQMASINTSSMEEGSRRVMASTITNLLSNVVTPDDLLEGCVTTLRKLLRCDDDHVESIEMGMLPVIQRLSDLALSSENELLRVHTSIRIVSLITLTLENRDCWTTTTTTSVPAAMEAMEFFWNQVRPWISHENRWLRQAAVRTMGLLGLVSTDTMTMMPPEEFTAVLLEISGHEMEDMEIRIQALLALTDWVLLQFRNGHGRTTNDRVFDLLCGQVDQLLNVPPAPLFSPRTIGCAAEIATKLILIFFMEKGTGPNNSDNDDARIRTWLARLVWLYFDHENLDDNDLDDCDNDDVSQVGHPVRLQQLLSVFFSALTTTPAMRHSSTYFIESITPLLTMSLQLRHKKQKATVVSLHWIRSIDFVVSCVSKSRQQQVQSELSPTTSSSTATLDETPAMDHDHDSESPTGDARTTEAQDEGTVTESSPGLIASVKVAAFLSEQGSMINAVIRRGLCKWISNQSSSWEVENELWEDLTRFKEILEELVDNDGIDDASCRRMLEPVLQWLRHNVESDVEDEDDEDEADDDGVAAALSNDFEKVKICSGENENPKSTVALSAAVTAKHSGTEIGSCQDAARRRNERARRRLRPSN